MMMMMIGMCLPQLQDSALCHHFLLPPPPPPPATAITITSYCPPCRCSSITTPKPSRWGSPHPKHLTRLTLK